MHQINSEDSLIREANRAKRRARDLETDPENWAVTVSCWIHALPSRPDGHRSPFDVLADFWTRPVPQARPDPRFGGDQTQAIQALQQRTAELQQQVQDLHNGVAQYRRARQEDQDTIAQLREELETGRGAREEFARDEDRFRRLEAEVATLTRAHEAQGAQMRTLQEECLRLETWRDTAKRDLGTLHSALSRVERERDEARQELEQLKAKLMPPNAFKWKAPREQFRPELRIERLESHLRGPVPLSLNRGNFGWG